MGMLEMIAKESGIPENLGLTDEEILTNLFPFGRVSPFAIILPAEHDRNRQMARDAYLNEPEGSKKKFGLMMRLLARSHTIPEFEDAHKIASPGSDESRSAFSQLNYQREVLKEARRGYEITQVDYERERLVAKLVVLRQIA